MTARSWLLLLCLATAATGVLQARAQPDPTGFISIDCGFPGTASYVDDNGLFPDSERSCYTLRPLEAGNKYLIRAKFLYGNYDDLSRLPVFDIYVGINFWATVNISSPDKAVVVEAIVVVPDDFVHVCLVNTGSGTPFISGLDLRPLKSTMYPQANATQGLVLYARGNVGPDAGTEIIRYPDDPHDREWIPYIESFWTKISTMETVRNYNVDLFEAPSKVMQTAAASLDVSNNIEFSWDSEFNSKAQSLGYVVNFHFSELQQLPPNAVRQFYINLNGMLWSIGAYTPPYLYTGVIYTNPVNFPQYNISINATANSTLPPIINAVEVFSVISTTTVSTDSKDVSAITEIKTKYHVQKNWMGDPCLPKTLAWNGLTCSYAISNPPSITGINLSFSGLSGDLSSSFANLKAVQYLYGNNPNLCTNADSCQTTKGSGKLAIYIAVAVVLVVVVVSMAILLICLLRPKKKGPTNNVVKPLNETPPMSHVSRDDGAMDAPSSLQQLENRRFTYKELEAITNNFKHVLGRGGFGYVYDGFLENGTQVAVKLRSDSSNQGVKEFLAEAQILTRIHKNLVSMIGYCKDWDYMALVYEYMSEGTLQESIEGNGHSGRFLNWRQRLKIALESAQGLEYLHLGCNPPLIHRDVKASNILLNSKLEAKIADFGLSKAFNRDNDTHISTNVIVGTPGYVDPEYVACTNL
ncbi:hypothetical protein PR202_ga05713 [Eleusine coracana subsp. coracana]|uniref:non-specific serine/threonine protein kinase n=1 Tax=Eleusine coracana subsp. coracana TaxID=191504 RepID=A0AAV5BUB6_ELECO|nr:hypothetical protein PR202_ga05713 [Eleusine coracana subsp. coracana]